MTFESELVELVERARLAGTPHAELEAAVAELHRKHGREVPPPITGTLAVTESSADIARAEKPKRSHKPTLASVAKQANKAAIAVARYEVKPDGTIAVVTGEPEPAASENPWLADLRKETKQ